MLRSKPCRAAALAAAAALFAPALARAETVLELFTSQSCSSCPPADALLGELAARPGVLALAFHVDYWNRLGWKDPYSSPAYTGRQRHYAGLLDDSTVYTPELVVNGNRGVVGSDRAAVAAAMAETALVRWGYDCPGTATHWWSRQVPARAGHGMASRVRPAPFDPCGGGENGGRVLEESNVVRSLAAVGPWSGAALRLSVPKPRGERAAVFLQRADGRIIGAASLPAG